MGFGPPGFESLPLRRKILKVKQMPLIVIEGNDSSGKKTQTELLYEKLKSEGFTVEKIHFPVYESTFGALVGAYLKGEFGKKEEIPPEIPSLLYAADRYQFKDEMNEKIKKGTIIITDRYYHSNLAYQGAKIKDEEERWKFIEWIKAVESRLPQPDIVIFLKVPIEVSEKLFEQREEKQQGVKKDIHEKDKGYLLEVQKLYIQLAEKEKWTIINCMNGDQLRSKEEIHEEIMKYAHELLEKIKGP